MKYNDATNNPDVLVADKHQDIKQIRKDCLRLLTRRDHSRKEIQNKLAVKGYDQSQVLTVIDELGQQNWQDDLRYAESYARVRSQKGFGPIRIAYELQQQSIAQDAVAKIIAATTDSWTDLLEEVYSKKYPGQRLTAIDNNEKAKRIRFLLQRGFPSGMINALFD
jgi:regulatory protein